jgi:hypothetical protein
MDCAAVKPKMEALVSGSLPPAERAMAEQHIAICEGCRLELELVRAIGSQEKQPAGSGSKDDWTLDRIFGAEGAPGASPAAEEPSPAKDLAPAAPSSRNESEAESGSASIFGSSEPEPASAPAPQHPALIPESDDSESQRTPGRKKVEASWSFEPADAKSDVKPPEESLFFAAEALTRKGSTAKGSNSRVVLWSLGGVVGVGLLVFSAWFVLHMNPGGEGPASRIQSAPSPAPTTPTTDPNPAPAPTDGEIQDEGGQAPNSAVEATPPPSPQPRVSASATPPQPRVSASTAPPQPMPLVTRTSTPQPSGGRSTTPVTRSTGSTPVATAGPEHHAAPAPAGPSTPSATPERRVTSTFMPPPDDMTSDDSSEEGGEAETPAVASPVTKPSGTSTPAARGSSMWESRAPKADPPAETETPAQPEVSTPIERLHLATVAATENGDLDGLRRLRATWKSFMVKILGPDRARAKREYADCLWAIQDATGRRTDQKDALAAYRDYLLGAPAGGADSRSVSRLRQLEDALSESR